MKNTLIWIATVIALAFIINWRGNSETNNQNKYVTVNSDTTVVNHYDNRVFTLPAPKGSPIDSVKFEVPDNVDTLAILRKFFTEFTYIDTLQDSNVVVYSLVKVKGNQVTDSKLQYKKLRPDKTITITNNIEVRKACFGFGGITGTQGTQITMLSVNGFFQAKNKQIYSLGYNLMDKSVNFGFYWPIKFRRNGKKN